MSYVPAMTFDTYDELGCVGPIRVMPSSEAREFLARLDAVTDEQVAGIKHPWYYKSYLLFTWMDALVRDARIVDHVERILGPDIMVMSADVWRKVPGETRHISWHQDAGYWHLEPRDIVTAWMAFTPATPENGCMSFALGTHRLDLVDHENTFAPDNMLSHGQTVKVELADWATVDDVLEPGEMSLHHALLAHGSGPNRTNRPRVGMCIRYLPGAIRVTDGPPVSAMLVRGRHTGNLILEDAPGGGSLRRRHCPAHTAVGTPRRDPLRELLTPAVLERTNVNLVIDGPPFSPRANRLKDGLKRTAFWPVISQLTEDFKVHNTYLKPDVFTDPVDEYWAMRRNAGLWDVTGEEVVEITGPDARRLIERSVPRKLDNLRPGKSLFAFLLYPHGGVVEDGVLTMFAEDRFWWVGGPGPAEVWLAANATGLDVTVRSYLDQIHLCAIQGPKSRDILARVSDIDLDKLPWFGMAEGRVCGVDTVVTRTGFTAELGYDIHIGVDRALDVYQGLREAGEPDGLVLCGSQAMNIRRMEAAILNIGAEIDWTTNPFELGWEGMLDWSRDFIGKDALAKLRDSGPGRRVAGLVLAGDTVAKTGAPMLYDGVEVGLVSSAIWGPSIEKSIALAMLTTPAWQIGTALTVETEEGAVAADVVELPFFDRERQLARA